MHSLQGIQAANDHAVENEALQAFNDGNYNLARRIVRANPDVFPDTKTALEEIYEAEALDSGG